MSASRVPSSTPCPLVSAVSFPYSTFHLPSSVPVSFDFRSRVAVGEQTTRRSLPPFPSRLQFMPPPLCPSPVAERATPQRSQPFLRAPFHSACSTVLPDHSPPITSTIPPHPSLFRFAVMSPPYSGAPTAHPGKALQELCDALLRCHERASCRYSTRRRPLRFLYCAAFFLSTRRMPAPCFGRHRPFHSLQLSLCRRCAR